MNGCANELSVNSFNRKSKQLSTGWRRVKEKKSIFKLFSVLASFLYFYAMFTNILYLLILASF